MSHVTRRSVDRDKAAARCRPLARLSLSLSAKILQTCPTAVARKMVAATRVSRVRDPASVWPWQLCAETSSAKKHINSRNMPTMPISILPNISHFFFLQKFYLYHLARVNVRLSHWVLEPGRCIQGKLLLYQYNIYYLQSSERSVLGSQIMGACTHKTQPPRTHAARTLGDNRFPSPRTARHVCLYTPLAVLIKHWKKWKTEKIGMSQKFMMRIAFDFDYNF